MKAGPRRKSRDDALDCIGLRVDALGLWPTGQLSCTAGQGLATGSRGLALLRVPLFWRQSLRGIGQVSLTRGEAMDVIPATCTKYGDCGKPAGNERDWQNSPPRAAADGGLALGPA